MMREKHMMRHYKAPVPLPTPEQVKAEQRYLKHKKAYRKTLRQTISVLIIVAAFAVLISSLLLPVVQITGHSMNPALEEGDIVLIFKGTHLKTGDIINFTWNNKTLIKRVLAVAGDWVEIDDDGTIYVNKVEQKEPYVIEKSLGQCDIDFPLRVGDDEYFVVGDDRVSSIDSRNSIIGNVKKEQLIGKVAFRIWPFRKIGFIN